MSELTAPDPEIEVGPEPLAPRIVAVEVVGRAAVRVSFETGEVRVFDASPLLDRGVFRLIREPSAFGSVSVVNGGGGIEWSAGPDLSAGRLYTGGRREGQGR